MKPHHKKNLPIPGGWGVLGGVIFGGAHELNGDSIESSVFSSLSLSSKGSQIILELNYLYIFWEFE